MTQYGAIRDDAEARLPPDAITVPLAAFSPEWEDRPKGDVCLGLRPVPPRDLEDARKAAADAATELFPRVLEGEPFFSLWEDHYYDMLLRSIVARGTCDPNDVAEPWEGWRDDPDDSARMFLTTSGAQMIFDAWERMRIGLDVTIAPATDDEVDELADRAGDIDRLDRARALRIRRHVTFCLAELRALKPLESPPNQPPITP